MLATLSMDIFPNLGGATINSLTGFSLQAYIGPYSTVSACIEMGICAFFYQKMFKKRFNTSKLGTMEVIVARS
uniref:Uncharacterized protein n=1 Tax=Panagrolaimus sp. PS1159 TaxID=55785 RepID=A0AC35F472_9BILA